MHCSLNIPSDPWSLAPFADADALRAFYSRFGCDGVELILCGEEFGGKIAPGMVRGLHLVFYPEWIALWQEDYAYLDAEFGSRRAWQEFYEVTNAAGLIARHRHEIETAQKLGAEYVVFHIGDNSLPEYFTLRAKRTDAEIVDASCAFLNAVFEGQGYDITLLLENMMFGGMDLTDPEMTRRALDGVRHPNTGVMLDTGHLMATNTSLRSEKQACGYLHGIVDAHGALAQRFWGMHLHRSLRGAYLRAAANRPVPLNAAAPYLERFARTQRHMSRADPHKPFTSPCVAELVQRIAPKWLVHELAHGSQEEWERALELQAAALGAKERRG